MPRKSEPPVSATAAAMRQLDPASQAFLLRAHLAGTGRPLPQRGPAYGDAHYAAMARAAHELFTDTAAA